MNRENKSIEISENYQIDLPASRRSMSIDNTDWERIKRITKQINDSYNRWENSAWATTSLFIGLLVACISTTNQPTKVYFGIGASALFIISFILFVVSRSISKTLVKSKEDVLFEMSEIEQKFAKDQNYNPLDKNNLEIISAIYGANNKFIDITEKLNKMINNNILNTTASNTTAGEDPIIGIVKELKIKYRYSGQDYEKNIPEGQVFTIPEF